jgi:hypothetical protein
VDLGAFGGKSPRNGAADAVTPGGYQHAQALDIEIHDRSEMSF